MGVVDFLNSFIGKGKIDSLTPEKIKKEEIKNTIREEQLLKKIEELEKEKKQIFEKGAKTSSGYLRRQLARKFQEKSNLARIYENELRIINKEITTLTALRLAFERVKTKKERSSLLSKINLEELEGFLKDEKVSTELYLEKLTDILSSVTEEASDIMKDLTEEGQDVIRIWEKMDEGEIPTVEEGIKQADKILKEKIKEVE